MTNREIDLENERRYCQLVQDCKNESELYIEPFKGWALKNAKYFAGIANFYARRAAQGE